MIKIYIALFLLTLNLRQVVPLIQIYKNASLTEVVHELESTETNIGKYLPQDGLMAYIVIASPINACFDLKKRPDESFVNKNYKWFAVVRNDFGCLWPEKLQHLREAGYDGVIMSSSELFKSTRFGGRTWQADKALVDIMVIYIQNQPFKEIESHYTYDKGYVAFLSNGQQKETSNHQDWSPWYSILALVIGIIISIVLLCIIGLIVKKSSTNL